MRAEELKIGKSRPTGGNTGNTASGRCFRNQFNDSIIPMLELPALLSCRLHKLKTEDDGWLSSYGEYSNYGDFYSNKFVR